MNERGRWLPRCQNEATQWLKDPLPLSGFMCLPYLSGRVSHLPVEMGYPGVLWPEIGMEIEVPLHCKYKEVFRGGTGVKVDMPLVFLLRFARCPLQVLRNTTQKGQLSCETLQRGVRVKTGC